MDDDIRIQSTMFGPNAPKEFDRAFLKRIVTSFLKTHMSAIVLGSDVALINTILHTLALFISPADRKRCRLAYHGAHIVMPEVRLQGILKDGTTQVSETILLEYTFPVTIIDLTENTVQHAPIYHEYLNVRNSFFFSLLFKARCSRRCTRNGTTQNTCSWQPQDRSIPPPS